ncbi:MAG: HigA family addiction module antidote protein [Cytophagales bacterium]|nr:HigA family addiction module antidote protein [Cytophagales bacterium]
MATQNQYFPQSVPHPGETLAEKLEEMKMGPKEFALRTGKPEKTIIAIVKGKSSITSDMAVQFEYVTKIPAKLWMNLQQGYDEYMSRKKRQKVIQEAAAWVEKFPLAEMIKKGWLPPSANIEEKTMEILAFFGFANHTAWEDYYFHQQLKVAFRISLAQTNQSYAVSAWLRKGELQAAELEAKEYSEKKFKDALPELKSILVNHPTDFFNPLQLICLEAGVKVVHVPCLNNAPIIGSTRWLNDTPFIQVSDFNQQIDHFWFTFFHEAGHILLHGKKEVFLENLDYANKDLQKEQEADAFAEKWTVAEGMKISN